MATHTINHQLALRQICEVLGMPATSSPYAVLCKVRETKAAADLPGAPLQIERDSSICITPETFAAWNYQDMDRPTELTLFADGSGTLHGEDGTILLDFETPADFAAFFDSL